MGTEPVVVRHTFAPMGDREGQLTKRMLLKCLKTLPEEFSIDELMERLIVIQKIDRGLKEMEDGKGLSTEEARKRMARWLT